MAEAGKDAIVVMPVPVPAVPTAVATEALAAAKAYARQALAPETLRVYAADWAAFTAWCRQAGCGDDLPGKRDRALLLLVRRRLALF